MVGPRSLGLYLPSQTKASRVKDACGLDARQKYYHFPFVRGINGAPGCAIAANCQIHAILIYDNLCYI